MTEEEKKAIEIVKGLAVYYDDYSLLDEEEIEENESVNKSIELILNLIEKLSKENEQLRTEVNSLKKENEELKNQEETARKVNKLLVERYSTSIPIQKVKEKIRKNEEIIDISNDGDLIHELLQKNKVYEELLEGEE